MIDPAYPPKPEPGDRVAVLSPSAGLPALFPLPYELGVRRIERDFGLLVVEYPTTRKAGASAQERAADIHAAFADPEIKAVLTSIGGDDQITVLPHLDRELLRANPKPFFGWSDNTNLLALLSSVGVVGYYGGSVMVEFGRCGAMHPLTAESLRAALFTSGEYDLREADAYGDMELPWDDPASFDREPTLEPCEGWIWHYPDEVVEGISWGGCLEVVGWLLMADREIGAVEQYDGRVLFLETSEELPRAEQVYRVLRCMGERGLLHRFGALLMGRAKTTSLFDRRPEPERVRYREQQREAVLRALDEYAPDLMAVFDVDFGHTDPHLVIPYGGRIRVDGPARRITVTY